MLEAIAVAAVALIGSVLSNAYFYGRLTERVSSHGRRLGEVESKVDDHETRISHLEGGKHRVHAN